MIDRPKRSHQSRRIRPYNPRQQTIRERCERIREVGYVDMQGEPQPAWGAQQYARAGGEVPPVEVLEIGSRHLGGGRIVLADCPEYDTNGSDEAA